MRVHETEQLVLAALGTMLVAAAARLMRSFHWLYVPLWLALVGQLLIVVPFALPMWWDLREDLTSNRKEADDT